MTIEQDIEIIKKVLVTKSENLPTFKAKIQKIGIDTKGRNRYMIYITTAARTLNLEKGDIVEFSLTKIGHKSPFDNNNPGWEENLKKDPVNKNFGEDELKEKLGL